ncbi:MAG TPA: hypothetical protein VNA16_07410 [Abditibacteriaceae bacterium]|nr:hypothetical protein [Abditibacteriaceae bacterium]
MLAYMAVRNSLAAAHRIANNPFLSGFSGWGPYQPPGVLHWLALALGSVLLLGGGLWQFMRARDERKAAPQARQDGAVGEFSVAQTGHGMDC